MVAAVVTERDVAPAVVDRPRRSGKFFWVGNERFFARGVTYGTFRAGPEGASYPPPSVVDADFAQMAANGINTVRTYTVPPIWLLDLAQRHGLRLLIGLAWEEHVAFLDDRSRAESIVDKLRADVRACVGHPAIFAYAIGNEIPASIVRWHGRRQVEIFLKRLYLVVKGEDPSALVTYVNYPSTEYLRLPFLDFLAVNVYLEHEEAFESYLARLQNLAGELPLLLAEIGLDSRSNGENAQAGALEWQIRSAFAGGCAGTFAFAWTDEWHRGGFDIEDWDFGLVDRQRQPKPALAVVRNAYNEVPFPRDVSWPRVSVVVCSYNGARTLRDCCAGVRCLDYPDYEAILIDDGSYDETPEIGRAYGFRVISTENRGLSNARNTGWTAATGEIVAYLDDDAWPDPLWLRYFAYTFVRSSYLAVGGPNLAPPGYGAIAEGVANAPGNPTHVLITDREAEHLPGCNLAIRRSALEAVGGFDPRFRIAGDDVDLCWRLQKSGGVLGFHPTALVWHLRRRSLRAYWRQQFNYGKAEAILQRKWPEKYNALGHVTVGGRIYGRGLTHSLGWWQWRIYHGTWNNSPYQSLYEPGDGTLWSLSRTPEWYLVIALLGILSLLGLQWRPLLFTAIFFTLSIGAVVAQAFRSATHASLTCQPSNVSGRLRLYALIVSLHIAQPFARLAGRLRLGLTPWRRNARARAGPLPFTATVWSECWREFDTWIRALETASIARRALVRRGGEFDRWDLEVRVGWLGRARLLGTVEEHGGGKQLFRLRCWPCPSGVALTLAGFFAGLAGLAGSDRAWEAFIALGALSLLLGLGVVRDCTDAMGSVASALRDLEDVTILSDRKVSSWVTRAFFKERGT